VASLYTALVTDTCLKLAGADGPIIVEGPFAKNDLFLSALASLVPRQVLAERDATGTTRGAALLAMLPGAPPPSPPKAAIKPLSFDLTDYARSWQLDASA
jgi:sugar (pentulose or hexulose) kinase